MSGRFDGPPCFGDSDDIVPFKRGELQQFKKRLAEHGKSSGNEAMATKMWRNKLRPRPKGKEDK